MPIPALCPVELLKLMVWGVLEALVAGSLCLQTPSVPAVVVSLVAPSIDVVTTVPDAAKPQTMACCGERCRT